MSNLFECSRPSHTFLRSAKLPKRRENGSEIRLFAHSLLSLDPRFAEVKAEMGESLRPSPRIFPFWRDYWQRPV
jgi:hypothetical protein